jgi:hypothetical protein
VVFPSPPGTGMVVTVCRQEVAWPAAKRHLAQEGAAEEPVLHAGLEAGQAEGGVLQRNRPVVGVPVHRDVDPGTVPAPRAAAGAHLMQAITLAEGIFPSTDSPKAT